MEKIKIQKGVKMPKVGGKGGRPTKYPFEKLKVGDSFYSPGVNTRHTIYGALKNYNGKIGVQRISISTRTEGDGIRVWRIE